MQPAAPDLEPDEALPALFDDGSQVGEAARAYVTCGVLIDLPYHACAERIAERRWDESGNVVGTVVILLALNLDSSPCGVS